MSSRSWARRLAWEGCSLLERRPCPLPARSVRSRPALPAGGGLDQEDPDVPDHVAHDGAPHGEACRERAPVGTGVAAAPVRSGAAGDSAKRYPMPPVERFRARASRARFSAEARRMAPLMTLIGDPLMR